MPPSNIPRSLRWNPYTCHSPSSSSHAPPRKKSIKSGSQSQLLNGGKSNLYPSKSSSLSLPNNERPSKIGVCSSSNRATKIVGAQRERDGEIDNSIATSHGKTLYRNYSVTGIPGDGRCMFRSVVHGSFIRPGRAIPGQARQRKHADDLRNRVADEFTKRRVETEWFIEGDFDSYVSHMRKPNTWGGEPELLMASHVLRMPIIVNMNDKDAGD